MHVIEDLTLAQLRAFATVARERSYARAAEQLGYTSSAVHQQMRALERVLGIELLHRGRSPLELTHHAESLLPYVDGLLAQLHDLGSAVRRIRDHNLVTIGGGRVSGVFGLAPVLSQYAAREDCDQHDVEF